MRRIMRRIEKNIVYEQLLLVVKKVDFFAKFLTQFLDLFRLSLKLKINISITRRHNKDDSMRLNSK